MSKDFYCPYCEKITKHFEKSWQEVYAGDGKKWEAFGMIMDMTGTSTLCKYAMNVFYRGSDPFCFPCSFEGFADFLDFL